MTVKDLCKLIYELRPDVDITVAGDFGEGVNDRAWFYSTIYDSKPPNFENMVTKGKEVTAVEITRGPELNDESVTVCFDMSKKEEKMSKEQSKEHLTIAKSGITFGMLLNVFKSEVFEIHFSGYEPECYIHGDLATGEVLLKILKDDVLNAKVVGAQVEAYGDDFAGISVTVDYDLDKEESK